MRIVYGDKLCKQATKKLSPQDINIAKRQLSKLRNAKEPRDIAGLNLKRMMGHDNVWEMRAGGQNRFILTTIFDGKETVFQVQRVEKHDIYRSVNRRKR